MTSHHSSKIIACYVLNSTGLQLANIIAKKFPLHLFAPKNIVNENIQSNLFPFESLKLTVAQNFKIYSAHIFIGAVGIAIRCIAEHIKHKSEDPAIITCDEKGQFVISLLSGHWGGANTLTQEIAEYIQAIPVITTATDTHNLPSIDNIAKQNNCIILDWDKVKLCNSAILRKETLQIFDPLKILNLDNSIFTEEKDISSLKNIGVTIHWEKIACKKNILRLTKKILCLGIGCKRGTPKDAILHHIKQFLDENNIEQQAIFCLATVDMKKNEQGLTQAAIELNLPIYYYAIEELSNISCPSNSPKAAEIFSLNSICICESAAIACAMEHHEEKSNHEVNLIFPKQSYARNTTLALAIR